MGYHQAALKLFANSLTIREKNFGPFNDYVENHREILAALYVKEKQKLKAIGLYQHALKVTQDKAALAEGNLSLARFYAQIGCHQSAEITYKVALRLLRQSQGPLNPSVINVFRELFCYYARQSNRTAQEQLAKEFVNSCSNSTCAKSLRVTSLGHLAWCYFRLKQYAKAESVLRQELALRDRSGSLLDSGLRVNLLNLAFVLEKLHNLTEAESCSKQLLNICTNESTQNALRAKLLATENLVTVYWKEGKLADAKPLLKQEEYLLSKTNVGGMRHFFDDQRAWFYYASGEYPASQAIFESRLRESNYVDVADLSGLKASYHLDKHEDELLPRLGSIISTRSTLRSDSSWLWNLIVGEFKNKADQGQIESLIKGSLNSSNQSDKEVLYPNFATVLLREHKGAVDFPSFHGH
jgi:tetratricopeptide (TPR) repeat protein